MTKFVSPDLGGGPVAPGRREPDGTWVPVVPGNGLGDKPIEYVLWQPTCRQGPHDKVCCICGAAIGRCCGNVFGHDPDAERTNERWACAGQTSEYLDANGEAVIRSRACNRLRDARLIAVTRMMGKPALEKKRR